MRFRIFFVDQTSIVLSHADATIVVDAMLAKKDFIVTDKLQLVVFQHITHMDAEDEGSESAVITPRTPATIKKEEEEKRQAIVGNPKAILTDIQNEEMSEEKL
jgi:hypothetical protein